jgi:lipopolysaccharide transport system ATP-binding protein
MSSESRAGTDGDAGPAIRLRGVGKTYQVYAQPQDRLKQMLWRGRRRFYREFHAVRSVDLDVWRGETVGIVGANGCGKSTLLKMICGLLEPSTGTIEVHGHIAPLLALGQGFNPDFTGRENVLLNAAILGLSDADIHARFDAIVAFADIGEFLDQPVRSYSSGMYARLAFAVAIHADPDVLVVDEILAVGDEAFTRKCSARIEQIKAAGSTILFVSHSLNRVVEICDRAILMDGGERLLTADPKTVVSQYRRLGDAPPVEAERIRAEIRALDGGAAPVSAPAPARAPRAVAAAGPPGELDPHLRPRSTVTYEPRGATIEDVHILDEGGRRVNVLRAGLWYTYAFDVRFHEDASGVRFGMMLKLPTGFEFSGQVSHGTGAGIEAIPAGGHARVRFPFLALLVPGVYFGNAGVLGLLGGEERYLHRILDAVIFRVEATTPRHATGRIDLALARSAEVEIETPPAGTRRAAE